MKYKLFAMSIMTALFATNLSSQSFTSSQSLQGYAVFGDKTTFIFDEGIYGVQPEKVVVTGEFRGWDSNMDVPAWVLKKTGTQWLLTIENVDYGVIRPNTGFKFRTDNGQWMDPPAAAPNSKGGNLTYEQDVVVNSLKAELRNPNAIWVEFALERPLSAEAYKLTDATGNEIPVAKVLPNEELTAVVVPAYPLDRTRVYFIEVPDQELRSHCSFDGWFRDLVSHKELGANIDAGKTVVRLFAPRAQMVRLYLYDGKDDRDPTSTHEMEVDDNGVWELTFDQDLHGVYYDFTIHGAKDPGNHFYETKPVHITDPYARVSDDTWGKARIWRRTTPAPPLTNGIPPMQDVIAYEVHVQDFSDLLPVDDKYKGTLMGMVTPGLTNSRGEKIGFDYLLDLGINVVHLMPVQEYVHFPTDDWYASFRNDPYMIDQGVSEENYQWGYRTSHAFAVESRYRTKGEEPGTERDEFRELVKAFHNEGIAVIIDIVPNHTAENMDANQWYFNFNAIDKQYYYRTKNLEHIGEYGNEVKTENRPMVQRWLIDQCLHWINEFGIDGFRIDLAGQIDQQTLTALKEALGPDKIVYGEAWIGSQDPNYEENPDWDWYKEDSPITFFQDDARNAFKGPVFELNNKLTDRGWPGGKYDERENVMKGLSNTHKDDKTPVSGINYLDIHDNFALADQFGGDDFDGRKHVDQDLYKIAVTLLYTSLGPIVTHGGSEIMRSKAHAPLGEVVKVTNAGYKSYMHGYRDTYNHRTANQFLWETVGQKPDGDNLNDYRNMHAFWQGLNALRLSDVGSVFRIAHRPEEGYYQWILPEQESLLGYVVNERVFVLLNAGQDAGVFEDVALPSGNWKLVGSNEAVDHTSGVTHEVMSDLQGGTHRLEVAPESLFIWIKE